MLQIFLQLFSKIFFAPIFLRRAYLCLNARAYARTHAHTYIKHYVCGIFAPGGEHTTSATKKRLIWLFTIFKKIFFSKLFGSMVERL